MIATFTSSPSFDFSPFAIAIFLIVPVAFSLTITSKLTVFSSPAFTSISQINTFTTPFSSIVIALSLAVSFIYFVISGTISFTSTLLKFLSELFITFIVYLIFPPFVTKLSPVSVSAYFSTNTLSYLAFIFAATVSAFIVIGVHPT